MSICAAAELFTNDSNQTYHVGEHEIDRLTADLASAAYSVTLRQQPKAWLELELELWNAMRAATDEWKQRNAH